MLGRQLVVLPCSFVVVKCVPLNVTKHTNSLQKRHQVSHFLTFLFCRVTIVHVPVSELLL